MNEPECSTREQNFIAERTSWLTRRSPCGVRTVGNESRSGTPRFGPLLDGVPIHGHEPLSGGRAVRITALRMVAGPATVV